MNNKIGNKPLLLYFLNSELERERLIRQIRAMHEKGFGGFYMHWLDCMEPYFGKTHLEALQVCIEEAARLGMEAWLYDEAWCPSCYAGGRVLARRPELQLKSLHISQFDVQAGETLREGFDLMCPLAIGSVPLADGAPAGVMDDLRDYLGTTRPGVGKPYRHDWGYYPHVEFLEHWRTARQDISWSIKWTNNTAVSRRVYTVFVRDRYFFDRMNRLDVLNPQSIQEFIGETHEKYAEYFGRYFGNVIPGIMTDEPSFGVMPWTDSLPDLFKSRYGYDLVAHLPGLIDSAYPGAEGLRMDYYRLISELFDRNYLSPMSEWCKKHNLLLTGHISPEECLTLEAVYSGNIMRHLQYFDIPGTDLIIQKVGNRENAALNIGPKQAASVAAQQGEAEVFVEYGACCEENLSLPELKHMIDWLLIAGCNLFCHHGFSYSLAGAGKFTTGMTLSNRLPLWRHMDELTSYQERQTKLFRRFRPRHDVALLKPQSSIRRELNSASTRHLLAEDKLFVQINEKLICNHIGFDYLDEDSAAEWKISGSRLVCGKASYRFIILPLEKIPDQTAADKLKEFEQNGGQILNDIVDDLPRLAKIRGENAADIMLYRGFDHTGDEMLFMLNMLGTENQFTCNGLEYRLPPFGSCFHGESQPDFKERLDLRSLTWRLKAPTVNYLPLLSGRTEFKIDPRVENNFSLIVESGELEHLMDSLKINGAAPDWSRAEAMELYDLESCRIPVELPEIIEYDTIELPTVYIAGNFAAFSDGSNQWNLAPPPKHVRQIDPASCGYPYLFDELSFTGEFSLDRDRESIKLELPSVNGVLEVRIDGVGTHIISWPGKYVILPFLGAGEHTLELRFSGSITGILRYPQSGE
jgi:hypothetical protein